MKLLLAFLIALAMACIVTQASALPYREKNPTEWKAAPHVESEHRVKRHNPFDDIDRLGAADFVLEPAMGPRRPEKPLEPTASKDDGTAHDVA